MNILQEVIKKYGGYVLWIIIIFGKQSLGTEQVVGMAVQYVLAENYVRVTINGIR